MNVAVFSDVHLKVTPDGEETLAEFVAFLKVLRQRNYDCIIILGDLFDFWFEYKHVIFSGYFEVLRAFADLSDDRVEMHLICGNHDFWSGRFLEKRLGIHVHHGPYEREIEGKRILFSHGDGVNPKDAGYRFYKLLARSPLVIGLFGLLHPDWAMAIAQTVSHGSREVKKDGDPALGREVQAIRDYATDLLQKNIADIVMCGHTHYAVQEEIETAHGPRAYINTGDWMNYRTYWEWDAGKFVQRTFSENASAAPRIS